jgi:diguanylate cyclase (GGDEF)-like protein/PAS domain S-box-containing protein
MSMVAFPSVFIPYLDLIYLLYGAAFILLGIAVLAQPRHGSGTALVRNFGLLAAFGLLHGANEWLALWRQMKADSPSLALAQLLLLVGSYLALFEFGRSLCCREGKRVGRWLSPGIYAPLLAFFLLGTALAPDTVQGAMTWTRYLFGFPGALLTGRAFLAAYREHRDQLPSPALGIAFQMAAVGFGFYGFLGGLVVAPAGFFPANQYNSGLFAALTGVPVEAARALVALMVAAAIAPILRFFHHRTRQGIREGKRLRNRHSRILEATGEGVLELNPLGRVTYANPAAARMLGYASPEAMSAEPILGLLADPQGEHPVVKAYQVASETRHDHSRFRQRDGHTFPVQFSASPLWDDGWMTGAVITFQDITKQQEAERQKRLAKVVYDHVPEGILVTDSDGRIESANPAFCRAMGYEEADLLGQHTAFLDAGQSAEGLYRNWPQAVDAEFGWQGELWSRTGGGGLEAAWVTVSPVHSGHGPSRFIAIYADLATQEEAQRRLHRLAYYDGLTGLPNRELFQDRLEQALIHARRKGQPGAVLFMDLDIFKQLNDTHGHATGDRLLEAIARRLPQALREGDTVARMAGDEFTVLLPSPVKESGVEQVAEKLLAAMATPFEVAGLTLHTSASIGLALFPRHGTDPASLVAAADAAMYAAKSAGGNRWCWAQHATTDLPAPREP